MRSTCRVAALPSAFGRPREGGPDPAAGAAGSPIGRQPFCEWRVERRHVVATCSHNVVAGQHRVGTRPRELRQRRRIRLCAVVVPNHEVAAARVAGKRPLHQRVVQRGVIDHQVDHQMAEFLRQRFDILPGAVARIDGAVVLDRETAIGVPRKERKQVQRVDGARQVAPDEAPQRCQRRAGGAPNRIGICDQGHVAGAGDPRQAVRRTHLPPRRGARCNQVMARPHLLQLRKRLIGTGTVEMPQIRLQTGGIVHQEPRVSMQILIACVAIIRRVL